MKKKCFLYLAAEKFLEKDDNYMFLKAYKRGIEKIKSVFDKINEDCESQYILKFSRPNVDMEKEGDVWIATQMVEVALDLDFYIIISQLAPMDALIQRMGRCNRHNTAREGEFYVLKDTKDGKDVYDVYDKETKAETGKLIKKYNNKILNMEDRKELLEQYYNIIILEQYYNIIILEQYYNKK